ncbi:phenylacetate-CoA oxygenase/reductase subunit PaaK [Tsukamurella sp. 8F]|uniref:1,2-phenylacetyl-CoA epoxidase subunit PaaE n=1 Tax=unclassified Tsukamurella TaxID=2633480 RepID=UPI0023B90C5E|nr:MULTISPECIES: 1,2-phenylacetyl-CoA epoxidase subunit PaaE [unclassified Tsukamurella]MDF0528991.1 phenylacetate-CoA oxygenase/reductase subunit PaaK [Tsukamurella sp. 8J]MDF0587364.1 phenylacetate-CoA oxygenase/reductase subunit PaaK [Tsukamurella sp. 8F]
MTAAALSSAKARGRGFHALTVAEVESLCDDAVAVTFSVPEELADEFAFAAGQSLTFRRIVDGVEHRRSYSICSSVGQRPRVGVREVSGGLFSTWLVRDVKAGDTIDVQGPTGVFAADPEAGGVHVLIAAGSGITPMLSIAGTMLANPEARVVLVYGNRRTRSVMFADEIADLKDRYRDRFDVIHILSREPRDVELFSGRVDSERLRTLLRTVIPSADVDHYWLCGPHGMVADAESVLGEIDVDRGRIHRELFYVDDGTPPPQEKHREPGITGPSSEVTVVLDGRSVAGTVSRADTILDGAEDFRSDLPFACKGGVCGTCRAKVLCGAVDMVRNYALEEDEVEAGFILTCQTYPTSDDVTVDFDA